MGPTWCTMAGMSSVETFPEMHSGGHVIDPAHVAGLRSSAEIAWDAAALRQRIEEDGYLYLPRLLQRDRVLEARREMTRRLAAEGHLEPGTDPMDAVAKKDSTVHFKPDLAINNQPLLSLLYSGRLMDWFDTFLSEKARHFDYTWI